MPRLTPRAAIAQLAAGLLLLLAALVPGTAGAAAPAADPFYTYDGAQPLASYEPGEVLETRTMPYHVVGLPTPVQAVQILYRSTDAKGEPAANVTSVLKPLGNANGKAVSYQSFYDSMNPEDSPSRAIAGDVSLGGLIANVESIFIAPLLAQGYTVLVPDTEGQDANFAAGPEYGYNTLDSIRASGAAEATGLTPTTRVGMLGYSGGAIATSWAGALAPAYAPDVNQRLVGFTEGGLLVAPAHNLKYVSGSLVWSGIAPMAIAGVARSFDIDFDKYLNDKGKQVIAKMEKASIINVLGQYPGLTWQQLVKPEYANPNSVPEYVDTVNKLNLGSAATPTVPMFVAQGGGGFLEGTSGTKPGIGAGDGVMIAGDVRTLMRQYCATGAPAVKYQQFNLLSHVGATVPWAPAALLWLNDRFAGKAAPSDCGRIAAGNPLTPEAHD